MIACNPLNLPYRFQLEGVSETACREAADPSVVFYQGRYWLFASKSGGYWHSSDLVGWTFVPSSALPVEDYAPDAAIVGDAIVVTASRRGHRCPIFRSRNPADDEWEQVSVCDEHNDPALFSDHDGRLYRYRGCSNNLPLFVCEMDPETFLPSGPTVELYGGNPSTNGWERRGEDHSIEDKPPHIEGAWVVKHAGRYYLEYASPGTQYNDYSDAVLVADSPLGPFALQDHNPHSYKPGGFCPGAGHGSTFQDIYGNWWHISTMRISVRHPFERRIGLWPAGFDSDGVLFCNTAFGDYPYRLPEKRWDPWHDPFAGLMLQSYRAGAVASSAVTDHPPGDAVDENIQTYWAAAGPGEAWLEIRLDAPATVSALQVDFTEHGATLYGRGAESAAEHLSCETGRRGFRYLIEAADDAGTWRTILEASSPGGRELPHDFHELAGLTPVDRLRLRILEVPDGHPAVSGFRVFGIAEGAPPSAVAGVRCARSSSDRRDAALEWTPSSGATAYNIRWGVSPDKLYGCVQVGDGASTTLKFLRSDLAYYFAVEAFGPTGVGEWSEVVTCR